LTEDEVLEAIPTLTRGRLVAFVEMELLQPVQEVRAGGAMLLFRRVDIARVQLLCDLTDDLGLDAAALGVVIGLLDQLHATRRELVALARAVDREPADIRARIGSAVLRHRR
jgi:chaperone modulatory protein CbpM